MFRLAHISDIHLSPLPAMRKRDFASKRVTGYLNWKRNRSTSMGGPVLSNLIADIKAHAPDHIAITGDLTNLALDAEIANARAWLETLGSPHDVSVVPGNHDAYVAGALAKSNAAYAPFIAGDLPRRDGVLYPWLRVRGDVALIGVNSARATPAFIAAGHVSRHQVEALEAMLADCGRQGLARVVMIHHPPVHGATSNAKRLYGIGRFQQAIARTGADLVLHGHTHLATTYQIAGPRGPVPVVCVPAAGQAPGGHRPAAAWNEFRIGQNRDGTFAIERIMRGIVDAAFNVGEIRRDQIAPPA